MLTLAESTQLGAFQVYRDVQFTGGARTVTPRFYALAVAPRLARDEDGAPAFRFLRYRELVATSGAPTSLQAGGLVTLTVDLAPGPDEQAALRPLIADHFKLADASAIEIVPVPIQGGRATLSFGGDTQASPDAFGTPSDVAIAGAARVCFEMSLSKDGAALLAQALDRNLAVLFASLAIQFEHRLDGISLHVWCDTSRAYATASSLAATGGLPTVQALVPSLLASRAAGIDVESDSPIPSDEQATLEQLGQTLLTTALAQTIVPPDPSTGAPAPRAPDALAEVTLNHTFTMTYPAIAKATIDGGLPLALTAAQRAASELDVDLAAGSLVLEVTAVCPIDFAHGLVSAVHVRVSYDATAADGAPFHRETDFLLRDGTARVVFRFDASPTQRCYTWRATVTYKDGTTTDLSPITTDETVLLVDAGRLGVLAVDLSLGDVPLAALTRAIVDLELPSKAAQHQVLLDGGTPSAQWQLVVGDGDPGPYRYRVGWLLADGRRVDQDAREGTATRLFLDAPRDLVAASTVTAIAAADFTDIAQIVVDLRVSADANADRATLSFTEAGKPQTWSFHTAAGPLRYQARSTVIDRAGIAAAYEFTDEDSPILVVRDVSRFEVQLIARLLDLGGAYVLALVTLEYDASSPPVQEVVTIRDRTEEPIWRVRTVAPDRHHYRYQLTLVAHDGTRRTGSWMESDEGILVLRPEGS